MSIRIVQHPNGGLLVDIRLRLPSGERVRERLRSPATGRSATQRWANERVTHLLIHGLPKPEEEVKPPAPTLAEFRERFIEGYAKANRQKHASVVAKESIFRHHLIPALGDKRLDEITTADVQDLKARYASGATKRSPKTVNCILTVLNTALRTAVAWGVIETAAAKVSLLKVADSEMRFYEPAEYERLVSAAARVDPRAALLVLLGGDAGLRAGEIVALEQHDVDHERGLVTVQRAEWRGVVAIPKGGRSRKITLTSRLAAALAGARHLRGPRVLYADGGEAATPKVLFRWMMAAQRLANLEPTGAIHILRHTFGARLAMAGAPARAIQELMGHRDMKTTSRYMHLSPAAKDAAIRLLEGPAVGAAGAAEGHGKGPVQEKAR